MDATDVLMIIQQYVNIKAVVLAVVFTKGLTYFLRPFKTWKVQPGTIGGRLLPLFPLLIGAAFCALIEKDSAFVTEDVVRGCMSGTLASYMYRTTKVSIFGE